MSISTPSPWNMEVSVAATVKQRDKVLDRQSPNVRRRQRAQDKFSKANRRTCKCSHYVEETPRRTCHRRLSSGYTLGNLLSGRPPSQTSEAKIQGRDPRYPIGRMAARSCG